jgi:O-antigen/teichoic acid export membrane protein
MLGQQRACAAIIVTAAVLNILLQLALVPRYGIIGAAISTTIVLTSAALANTVVARRRLGIDIAIWRNIGRR